MRSTSLAPPHRQRGFAVVVSWVLRHWVEAAKSHESNNALSLPQLSGTVTTTAGDLDTFEAFFRRYEPQISGYLRRLTREEETAEDLSQETFFRAWQHYPELRAYPHPLAWLFRVATNLALNHMRHGRVVGIATPLNDENTPTSGDPAAQVAENDQVHQTLLLLPPRQRALLVLREVYGLSCEEAGQAVGMSHANARKMISRAREQFRQLYLRKDGQP